MSDAVRTLFFFLLCFFTAVLAVEKTSFHHKSRIRVTSKRSIAFWVCLWALRSIIAFSIKLSAIVCRIQLGGVSFRSYKDRHGVESTNHERWWWRRRRVFRGEFKGNESSKHRNFVSICNWRRQENHEISGARVGCAHSDWRSLRT